MTAQLTLPLSMLTVPRSPGQAKRQAQAVDPWAKNRTRFHAAHYTGSPRLQAVLKILADGQWHSGIEIAQGAGVLNPSGAVSELNAPINGMGIETEYVGGNGNGRRVWRYKWMKREA